MRAPSLALLTISFLLLGCNAGQEETISELQKSLKELETQLDRTRIELEDQRRSQEAKEVEFQRSLSEAESRSGDKQTSLTALLESRQASIDQIGYAVNFLQKDLNRLGAGMVEMGLGYQGHAVCRSPHGAFLLQIKDQRSRKSVV